jgi:hypothetical protein
MHDSELDLTEALAEAQRAGFAEADPAADLNGGDAAAKLSILAYRAFGAWVRPDAFPVRGITALRPCDCDLAEAMGHRVRLIARAERVGDALDMAVEPLLLPAWHLLASVEEEYNAVYLKSAASGDLSLFGKGAGALPAAAAVLGDLIDLAHDTSVRWPEPRPVRLVGEGGVPARVRRHYLRVSGPAPGDRSDPASHLQRLEARFDRLIRRSGLAVQDRAVRRDETGVHVGYVVSDSTDAAAADLRSGFERLGLVDNCMWLGVMA